jgi:hypothetical protein
MMLAKKLYLSAFDKTFTAKLRKRNDRKKKLRGKLRYTSAGLSSKENTFASSNARPLNKSGNKYARKNVNPARAFMIVKNENRNHTNQ